MHTSNPYTNSAFLAQHEHVVQLPLDSGWYLPECAHPYMHFKRAGYKVDIASVKVIVISG